MRVYCPVGREQGGRVASRVGANGGEISRVGIVNNDLDPGLMRGLVHQIGDLFPDAELKTWLKPNNGAPEQASTIAEVAGEVDVAVAGVGMCGSCTASVLMDAIRLWKSGVPTVAVVWDSFEATARSHAALHGVPELPISVVEQLVIGQTEGDQEAKAEQAARQIHDLWAHATADPSRPQGAAVAGVLAR